jgi:hypothetical protein
MLAGPRYMLVVADLEQQVELLGEQRVVVLEPKTEQGKGIDERAAPYDHLRAALRDEIECGEILEYAHRVGRAEDCYGAGETYATGSRRSCGKNDWGSRVQEILAVVLADSEDIESNLIRVLDLLDEVAQALRFADRAAGFIVRSGEAVNTDFHL